MKRVMYSRKMKIKKSEKLVVKNFPHFSQKEFMKRKTIDTEDLIFSDLYKWDAKRYGMFDLASSIQEVEVQLSGVSGIWKSEPWEGE